MHSDKLPFPTLARRTAISVLRFIAARMSLVVFDQVTVGATIPATRATIAPYIPGAVAVPRRRRATTGVLSIRLEDSMRPSTSIHLAAPADLLFLRPATPAEPTPTRPRIPTRTVPPIAIHAIGRVVRKKRHETADGAEPTDGKASRSVGRLAGREI